jgi:putative nucleotidyltransferase with HDIG domain
MAMLDADSGPVRVLVVDDEQSVRDVLTEGLTAFGYRVRSAASAAQARALVEAEAFDLALCDIDMPGERGTELLGWLKQRDPHLAVVMITGIDDAATAVSAMLSGASDYLCKPFRLDEVRARTAQALDKRRLELENLTYQRDLERLVDQRTREVRGALQRIEGLNAELREAYDNTLSALMIALDYRDNETQGHSLRVVEFADRLARELGLEEEQRLAIRRGAMLHDVGKIGVPDAILRKPGGLDGWERHVMKMHPQLGYEMLHDISFLASAAEIVLTHHERWDGSGYPRGLRGDQIPIGARIFAVADALDAMTSDRPYRRPRTFEGAREELVRHAGDQFDPGVVEAFLRVAPQEWDEVTARVQEAIGSGTRARRMEALLKEIAVAFQVEEDTSRPVRSSRVQTPPPSTDS